MMWPLREKSAGHMIDVNISGDNVLLRPAVPDDYEQWALVRGRNRDYLKPFEPRWPDKCLEPDFFKRRVERLTEDWLCDRCYAFLVFEKASGELIGGININIVSRGAAQFASLGYWLDEQKQGKGFMTEAGRGVLDYAFSVLNLARMNAATLPHNQKSRNILLRLGFTEEGFARKYIQIDGHHQDHVLFGLNADDFLTRVPTYRTA